MNYGICHLAVTPVRSEPQDEAEMTTQLLFGECIKVLESHKQWRKVRSIFDNYIGWIDEKQFIDLNENEFETALKSVRYNSDLFLACKSNKRKLLIPLGSSLPSYKNGTFYLKDEIFEIQALVNDFTLSKDKLLNIATNLLETPYLWGGRNPMGIDCSGFSQIIYKCIGISLHRDAKDQELQGEEIANLNNAKSGDLAFFINDKNKIHHVGLLHENKSIIHAAGKVRLDKITEEGIFNVDKSIITHKLHSIKRFL